MKIVDLEVTDSELFAAGGFCALRRCRVRNVREDGSRSGYYLLDLVERPGRADAVVVLPYAHTAGGPTRVLLRRGLRPAMRLARAGQPTREGLEPDLTHTEAVAGILEPVDEGPAGVQERAAIELAEEVGLDVDPRQITELGPPVYLSPGILAERIYFCGVRVTREALEQTRGSSGDGSCLEEGGETIVCELEAALQRCARGELADAKTELALRRLHDRLEAER